MAIVLCAVLAGATACGSGDPIRIERPGGGASGSAADPAPDGDGAAPPASEPEPSGGFDAGSKSPEDLPSDVRPEGECGASTFEAQEVVVQREVQVESQITVMKPVSLYLMFDQSLSMQLGGLWDPAVSALKSFVNDAKSKDVGVGIQYFPNNGGSCNGKGYSTPAVALGVLPGQAQAIADSLDDHDPSGIGTPIEGALRGSTEFCKQYQKDHPEEQCVAVLVTDGKPEFDGCEKNHDTLAGIAKAAHDAGVTTFAVGLSGADFALLDKIAQQGGAPDCDPNGARYACDVSSGANKLADALTSIRDTVVKTEVHTVVETQVEETKLPCEWAIPEQPEGEIFDRDKVNIRLTIGDTKTTFLRVPSAEACRADAWRFDDPKNPTRLLACPQTCERIEAEPQAKLEVLLGCATAVPQ
ncbi:MAG TPA: vWA domain-containing protein [Polyangiales bacterium]|nr:vWA domain-containing protein [Polyangiales bacterium]